MTLPDRPPPGDSDDEIEPLREGGVETRYVCQECGYAWREAVGEGGEPACPICGSDDVTPA